AFCEALARYGGDARAFAVDSWQGDEHAGHYGDQVYEHLRRFHDERYRGFSELLRTTFAEALPYFGDGTVDLLHIDGCHTYAAVRERFAFLGERWVEGYENRANLAARRRAEADLAGARAERDAARGELASGAASSAALHDQNHALVAAEAEVERLREADRAVA